MHWAMKTDHEKIERCVGVESIRISTHCWAIPPDIMLLKKLRCIDASNSSIQTLPLSIANLHNLELLILHHTYVKTLPESFKSLGKLIHVDIEDNGLMPHQAKRIKAMLPQGCELIY